MASSTKSLFDLPEFKPYGHLWHGRRERFRTRRAYYEGTVYQDSQFRLAHKLYAATKALFLPLARAVDLDVALIPGVQGAWALDDAATDQQRAAQALLYGWSNWAIEGDTWLEDGTTYGEALIKVVGAPGAPTVQLQRLDPEVGMLCRALDADMNTIVDMLIICDPNARDAQGEQYEYGEVITPRQVRTYRNGDPHGFAGAPDRWDNPVGFTPVVPAQNDSRSRPTFFKCQPQLDSVNELASYLNDIIGRHAEPQWAVAGVEEGELVKSGANVWFLPAGAKVEAVLATIDVAGTLAFIQAAASEMKAGLPELVFDDLKAKDQIAAETLRIQLIELIAKLWKQRRRYDGALCQAHAMAAQAASALGVRGLEALLLPHAMDAQRPVLPEDRLSELRIREAELAVELAESATSGDGLTATATPAPVQANG